MVRVTHVVLRVVNGLHPLLFTHPDTHPPTLPQPPLEAHPPTLPQPQLEEHDPTFPDTHPILLQAVLLQL